MSEFLHFWAMVLSFVVIACAMTIGIFLVAIVKRGGICYESEQKHCIYFFNAIDDENSNN